MEYHLLILTGSNESLVCRYVLKGWNLSVPFVVLYSSKDSEDFSDFHLEPQDTVRDFSDFNVKDSLRDSGNYKYSLLYRELNKLNSLTQEEFETLLSNLVKYVKTVLFRPLLLLFRKDNNFRPNILFNTKPVLSYYHKLYSYPISSEVTGSKPVKESGHSDFSKDLLYWYFEFVHNYNLVGTNTKLVKLLEELEDKLNHFDTNDNLSQLLLSTLNMYIDGLLFRNISLSKYTNVVKYTKLYSSKFNTYLRNNSVRERLLTQKLSFAASESGPKTEFKESKSDPNHSESGHGVPTQDLSLESESVECGQGEKELNLSEYKKLFLENKKPYHIASAIAYTNGYPHVGHAYEAIVCDVIGRYYKAFGRPVIFSTGTDEHGIKVMTTARQQNKKPIEICDFYSNEFKKLYKTLMVEYDRFIRTTSLAHITAARTIWRRVYRKGDIYLGKYNGYYSVREERFIPNTEAKLTDYKDPVSGKPYDLMSESSFFFKMDRYRDVLVDHIKKNYDFIYPSKCRNEILTRLKENLEDLSISRTSFDWGIEVPHDIVLESKSSDEGSVTGDAPKKQNKVKDREVVTEEEAKEILSLNNDVNIGYNEDNKLFNETKFYNMVNNVPKRHSSGPHSNASSPDDGSTPTYKDGPEYSTKGKEVNKDEKHVMYVWFDALSFYMTASGLGESFSEMTNWPTDLQVIGKDICWFQSVILATMCFSMEVPLTRRILAHGFIQGADGRKMSKSLGNVINLEELLKEVGVESFRYYLMRSTVLGSDVNFDVNQLKEMYNSDLADNVGNLVHRLTSLVNKYNQGKVPEYRLSVTSPFDLAQFLRQSAGYVHRLDLYGLLSLLNLKFKDLNNYTTTHSPWSETNSDKRDSVLRLLLETVYFLAHFLFPVLPESTSVLFKKLGTPMKSNVWELSLSLDNLDVDSKVSVGDVLYQKFKTQN